MFRFTRKRMTHANLAAALVALLAVGALGSASASAAPEISPTPKSGAPLSFTGSGGYIGFSDGLISTECKTTRLTGEMTNPREVEHVKVIFEGCDVDQGHLESTEALKGRLGYANRATKEVGLLLEPEKGEVFAKDFFETHYASGGLIGETGPIDTKHKTIELRYALKSGSIAQAIPEFEGETKAHFLFTPELSNTQWGTVADITLNGFEQEGKAVEVAILAFLETSAATNVEATKAKLNGTVEPKGLATKYHFQYGTTTSYGSSTSEASAGEGTSPVPVSANISGLTAGVTYHFRVVATNSLGTNYGEDVSFTTGAPTLQPAKGGGAFPVAFTATGGKTVWKNGIFEIECSGVNGNGKFTGVKEGAVSLKMTGCKDAAGEQCGKGGEIETKELESLLAYTYPSKSKGEEGRETGLVLSPASGEVVSEFECEGRKPFKVTVKGSFIGVVSPLKTQAKTFALAIKQSKQLNEPSEYETESGSKVAAGLKCSENGGTAKQCGLGATAPEVKLTSEEATIGEG